MILVIFAGAAAEFALNKAVDWLYFTGRLPADPLGRLFSTVAYARQIIFSETPAAHAAIDRMRQIHSSVETARGFAIPDEAYRDVLFMLIYYSIASYELLERKLTAAEKEELLQVFLRVGRRMQLKDLPQDYASWQTQYAAHQQQNLRYSHYTTDLFRQYRKHLGLVRYRILLAAQQLVVNEQVKIWLPFNRAGYLAPVLPLYKLSRSIGADRLLKALLLPPAYKQQILALDVHASAMR